MHRDLKPENLLLSDPSDSAILKIADFGLSAVVFASENIGVNGTGPGSNSSTDACPTSELPFAHPDNVTGEYPYGQSPGVESVLMREHEAALRSKVSTHGAHSAHSPSLSSPQYEHGASGQGQNHDRRRGRPAPTSTATSTSAHPHASTHASGPHGGSHHLGSFLHDPTAAAEMKEREFREELAKERGDRHIERGSIPIPASAVSHSAKAYETLSIASGSLEELPQTPLRHREVNFITPTYCTPPATATRRPGSAASTTDTGSALSSPDMLGPPLPSSFSRAQAMSGLSQQFAAYTPGGMGQGAPIRRLRSVVGSPHYIAPEIASNGTFFCWALFLRV